MRLVASGMPSAAMFRDIVSIRCGSFRMPAAAADLEVAAEAASAADAEKPKTLI